MVTATDIRYFKDSCMLALCPVQLHQMLSMWGDDEDDLILNIRSKMMSSKNRRVPFRAQVPRFLQILDPSYNTSCRGQRLYSSTAVNVVIFVADSVYFHLIPSVGLDGSHRRKDLM